jgi:hypothetical protein
MKTNMTHEERFWAKVEKRDGCWAWNAYTDKDGYAMFTINSQPVRAHRMSWELANGPIPEGLEIDHRCLTRDCVNPDHLRVATKKQNREHLAPGRASKSGKRGVYWSHREKKWYAQCYNNATCHFGGYFHTIEEADTAAIALRNSLFTHNDLDRRRAS